MTKREMLEEIADIIEYDCQDHYSDDAIVAQLKMYIGEQIDLRRKEDFDDQKEGFIELLMNFDTIVDGGYIGVVENLFHEF